MNKKEQFPSVESEEAAAKSNARLGKILAWAGCGVALITIGVLLYIFAYKNPANQKGHEAIAPIDMMAFNQASDSTLMAGYEEVAQNHKFDAANRAKYMSAVYAYKLGDYQKALDYISDYDGNDEVVAALAYGIKGDCLVNLDKLDEALEAFDDAIDECDENPQLMPYFMTKKAVILSEQGKHDKAAELYKEIENKYPRSAYDFTHSRMLQEESLSAN